MLTGLTSTPSRACGPNKRKHTPINPLLCSPHLLGADSKALPLYASLKRLFLFVAFVSNVLEFQMGIFGVSNGFLMTLVLRMLCL